MGAHHRAGTATAAVGGALIGAVNLVQNVQQAVQRRTWHEYEGSGGFGQDTVEFGALRIRDRAVPLTAIASRNTDG